MSAESNSIKILHYYTAGKDCYIALFIDGAKEDSAIWDGSKDLSLTLPEKTQEILDRAEFKFGDVSAISIFQGPGSFTGLRIGFSYVNALAYALKIPVYLSDDREVLGSKLAEGIPVPNYGAEPKITKPKNK
jgi:tRNA threonylcarbamoyladenosine biosynthesis protein TsaB